MAAQEALKDEVVEATVGGGMVTVEVTGELVFKSIKIAPEAVDPDDPEMLQDMVLAAVTRARLPRICHAEDRRLRRRTRGLGLPASRNGTTRCTHRPYSG